MQPEQSQPRRMYAREDFASNKEFTDYRWAKGTVGEVLLGKLFFKPAPPRRIVDGHGQLKASGVFPKNLYPEACHLDTVLFNDETSLVEGILEIKTTTTTKSKFDLRGACGLFMQIADKTEIPIWFGIVRLVADFPKEILEVTPEAFIENTDLTPYVAEAVVYERKDFTFDQKRIRLVPGAAPVFRWKPSEAPKR